MDVVLIPGLWLDASSWDAVVPAIEAAGHRAHPLTLPGLGSVDDDRSGVTLRDQVDAVVAAIDRCADAVMLVGHSAGAGVAWAAVDARVDRIARLVAVGGFPTPHGLPLVEGLPVHHGEVTLPDFDEFDPSELAGLDAGALASFRARAIPSPGCVVSDLQRLSDDRRYGVPVTVVCPEFSPDDLRRWIESGAEPVQELARLRDVEYVDLDTGHWPQFSAPDALADLLLDRLPAAG
ncbi:MAG: alpha/beta hydrolase [Acidimicrobiales bacterium]|nr:alpha/beta hydrolase [Acidimicrobiales bacterium]MCB9395155.1 alpha/beta hydrolase [Acidimicrobiaceae bacterium]